MANVVAALIWFFILLSSFSAAGTAASLYIVILPFTVCAESITGLTDFLLIGVQCPRYCAKCMMEQIRGPQMPQVIGQPNYTMSVTQADDRNSVPTAQVL